MTALLVTGAAAQVQWNRAVRLANEEGDNTELVALLLSDVEMTPGGRKLLADLLDRHNLRKKRGAQKLPINRQSAREVQIASAVNMIRRLIQERGRDKRVAVAVVAEHMLGARSEVERWEAEQILLNALAGKRGSAAGQRKPKSK
jgi:hypothetical protein